MSEPKNSQDFFSLYLAYTSQTECPTFFHRWTAITSLSAYLGRDIYFLHGHFTIYPSLYTMLLGSPGTKKSSAIKIGTKLLKQAGYVTFAAKKTRQEKFLLDLAEQQMDSTGADMLDANLWGTGEDAISDIESKPPAECFVAADEFNNFIGVGNLDFMSILGELWDYEGVYDYRLKNSKDVFINEPCVTILGGNTPTGFAHAFPTEAIGQGFFSRLLLVYGEPSGVKFTFPPPPDLTLQAQLVAHLQTIKESMAGEVGMSENAADLLHKIYHEWEGIDDVRFEHYANRRLTQLLKLCLIVAASRLSMMIETSDVIYANTVLTFTEHLMPKALGEFGRGKNSEVTHKVLQLLDSAHVPQSIQAIWKHVHQDLEKRDQLIEILGNLTMADKIQTVEHGYLPKKAVRSKGIEGAVDWNLLSQNERDLLGL